MVGSLIAILLTILFVPAALGQTLASLEHHVVGARLRVAPGELFVPKSIPGSLMVELVSADGTRVPELDRMVGGAYVEAVLRGPAFPAYRLLGLPNEPLMLPPLPLVGEYQIDDIRLVDLATGSELMTGSPSQVAVHVFPEVLVSRVESRPLSLDEIHAKGIVIDDTNFSAVEFEAMFVLEGRSVPVRFPVVTPKWRHAIEVIPAAEIQERLVEAERLNKQIAESVVLPPELKLPGLNLQIQGLNFQRVADDSGAEEPEETPIPALIVIPGQIGFLNQFFSVQVYTGNAAPVGSGINVHDIQASIVLPAGKDGQLGTADDPVRMARVGPNAQVTTQVPVRGVGQDGQADTPDDEIRIQPGQTAQGEFLVEGLRTGLHVLEIQLDAVLDGYAHGEVHVQGKAAGSVLVRDARFSVALSHPRTVRVGEPYTASVTVMNTSEAPRDLVSVNLTPGNISGARLADGQAQTIELGTILPGESQTAHFRLVSMRTGSVQFSNFKGSEGVTGRFDFTMGVDERGVALSAGVIGYPRWTDHIPAGLMRKADRVLGQALSTATAAQLPPGVRSITDDVVRTRVVELAEAGQRLAYGDPRDKVLLDLLLDWHGGRKQSLGFDQILRETEAGADFRSALVAELAKSGSTGHGLVASLAADVAGRGEAWGIATTSAPSTRAQVIIDGVSTGPSTSSIHESGAYTSTTTGPIVVVRDPLAPANIDLEIVFELPAGTAPGTVSWAEVTTGGTGRRLEWSVNADPTRTTCYRLMPTADISAAVVDLDCDATSDGTTSVSLVSFAELPPAVVAAVQDLDVLAVRPWVFCGGPQYLANPQTLEKRTYQNYGSIVALLFSKPVSQASVEARGAFQQTGGGPITGASVQPGGRVVLVNLFSAIGNLKPASMDIQGVADVRGNALGAMSLPITTYADVGVAVQGQVVAADGTPIGGIPVTLTMIDQRTSGPSCVQVEPRVSQVATAPDGTFKFDFVAGAMGYRISATDTRGLNPDAIAILMEASPTGTLDPAELERQLRAPGGPQALQDAFQGIDLQGSIAVAEGVDRAVFQDYLDANSPRLGSTVPVALRFRGRGTVRGIVYEPDGVTPVSEAAVNLFPDASSRELGRGVFSASDGTFAFHGVPLGTFTVDVETSDGRRRVVAARLISPGEEVTVDIIVSDIPPALAQISGVVLNDDLTPHVGAQVFAESPDGVIAGQTDANGMYSLVDVPIGQTKLTAISFDGGRATRRFLTTRAGESLYERLVFPGLATVAGHVFMPDGSAAGGALVAGGRAIVTADAQGAFILQGVPVGSRQIEAGLPADPANGRPLTKIGSALLEVVPGAANYVDVSLRAAGRIFGRVLDAQGGTIRNVNVAIPTNQGFYWTPVDSNGWYSFFPLPLDTYLLSAPAPMVVDVGAATGALASGDMGEIQSALTDVLGFYGSGFVDSAAQPVGYGYTTATLVADDQELQADIRYLETGPITGTVLNHQGTPIGARVVVSGTGRDRRGKPKTMELGETLSNPGTGEFLAEGVPEGFYQLAALSPFYSQPAVAQGTRQKGQPIQNVILQFPAPTPEGVLEVLVLQDDLPVANADVHIDYLSGLDVLTQADGTYARSLPMGTYTITAAGGTIDQGSGPQTTLRQGLATTRLTAGVTNRVVLRYLADDAGLDVFVRDEGGVAIPGATVTLERTRKPSQGILTATTDASGHALFAGLLEGPYAIQACHQPGQTQICTRGGQDARSGESTAVTLTMAPTASIQGFFADANGDGVEFGQVVIGKVAIATTGSGSAAGQFTVDSIPLGRYLIEGVNSLDGRRARAEARLTTSGQVAQVLLTTAILGEISGQVIGPDGVSPSAGAQVTVDPASPLSNPLTVTTDPAGRFLLPGVPPGAFTLIANEAVRPSRKVVVNGTMPDPGRPVVQDIYIPLLADLLVVVERQGTLAPVTAHVTMNSIGQDTDGSGQATFNNLDLRTYSVLAESLEPQRTNSAQLTRVTINATNPPPLHVALSGVGSVSGYVTNGQGQSVGAGVSVTVDATTASGRTVQIGTQTDVNGHYSVTNIPPGSVVARAASVALGGVTEGVAQAETDTQLDVQLGAAGDLSGRIVGSTGAISGATVLLQYTSQTAALGSTSIVTTANGGFAFPDVPVGDVTISTYVAALDGVISRTITVIGGPQDVGDLVLDEDIPYVAMVSPLDGATDIPVSTSIQVDFSEAMDTLFQDPEGAYLLGPNGPVALDVTWPTAQQMVLTPLAPLVGETQYSVVIVAGEVRRAVTLLGAGPTDLAGRYLLSTWVSTFTTADAIPPQIISLTPADGSTQIDPSGVVRAQFSEAMTPDARLTVQDAQGSTVPGTTAFDASQQVLVFAPSGGFATNQHYLATLQGSALGAPIRDLAGNQLVDAQGAPVSSVSVGFDTLDTVGPTIVGLTPMSPPVAGASTTLVAQLAAANVGEPDVQIEATTDLSTYSRGIVGSTQVVIPPLPQGGPHQVLARAIDQYGNVGPWYTGSVTVNANAPPTISITQTAPANGPLLTGQAYGFRVLAQDDGTIASLDVQLTGAFTDSYSGSHGDVILAGDVPDVGPGQVTIVATAVDSSGASVTSAPLVVSIADDIAPSLAVAPPSGLVVDPGATIAFDIAASDAFGLTSVVLNTPGATPASQSAPLQPGTSWQGVLQAVAPTGPTAATIAASVTVTDVTGLSTTQPYSVSVRDTVPPVVTSVTPADGATGVAAATQVTLSFSEPVVGATGAVVLEDGSGAAVPSSVSYNHATYVVILTPNSALVPGAQYTVRATGGVTDAAGLPLAGFASAFTVAVSNEAGPRVLAIRPADNEVAVALQPYVEVDFDAQVDPAAVTSSILQLELVSAGTIVPMSVSLSANDQLLRARPQAPLIPGETYRVTLDGTTLVGAGTGLRVRDGATDLNFTSLSQTFRTRQLSIRLDGQALAAMQSLGVDGLGVEGFTTTATVNAEAGATINSALWFVDGAAVGVTYAPQHGFELPVPSLAATPGGAVTVSAQLQIANLTAPLLLGPASLGIAAATSDADADTIPNHTEASLGLDPWRNDAIEDPDLDNLTNLTEVALGTNPLDPDTDHDGTNDDVDPDPLSGPRPPYVGVEVNATGVSLSAGGSFLQLPAATRLQPPFTWEFLFAPANVVTGSGVLLDSGSNDGLVVDFDAATNTFGVTLDGASGAPVRLTGSPSTLCTSVAPCHVAVTHDGAKAKLFVSGNLVDVATHGPTLDYAAGEPLTLTSPVGTSMIFELRLWSAARSIQAVQDEMLRRPNVSTPGLRGYWRSSDHIAATLVDSGPFGLHGTWVGTPTPTTNGRYIYADTVRPHVQGAGDLVGFEVIDPDAYFNSPYPQGQIEVTTFPSRGRLFQAYSQGQLLQELSPGSASTFPFLLNGDSFAFAYFPDPGFSGDDAYEYRLVVTGPVQASGPILVRASKPARVDLHVDPAKTWAPIGGSADWHDTANWSPAGVPTTADDVLVPAGALPLPVLSANASAGSITIEAGASVDLAGQTLSSSGNVWADGAILNGSTVMTSNNTTVRGTVDHLVIRKTTGLAGDILIAGDTQIVDDGTTSGSLTIGAHTAHALGQWYGRLPTLTSDLGIVDIDGSVDDHLPGTSRCANAHAAQTAGELRVSGDITIHCDDVLYATGAHRLVLDGVSAQVVDIAGSSIPSNWTLATFLASTRNHLHDVVIDNLAGVSFPKNVVIGGALVLAPGASASFGGAQSYFGSVDLGAGAALTSANSVTVVGSTQVGDNGMLQAGDLHVAGATTVGAGASLTASGVLEFSGSITADPTASVSSGSLVVGDVSPLDLGVPFTDLTVAGPIVLGTNLVVPGSLTITTGGNLTLNGHAVTVSGHLIANGGLQMSDPAEVMDVTGDIYLHNSTAYFGTTNLTAGSLRGSGDFTIGTKGNGSLAIGQALVLRLQALNGTIAIHYNNLTLGDLQITGSYTLGSDVTVAHDLSSTGNISGPGRTLKVLNDASFGGATVDLATLSVGGSLALQASTNVTVSSAIIGFLADIPGNLSAGTLTIGSASATRGASTVPAGFSFSHLMVDGDVALNRDVDIPAGGQLTVTWDVSSTPPRFGSLDFGNHTLTTPTAQVDGALIMNDPSAILTVLGDLVMSPNCNTPSVPISTLTDGEIHIGGDLRRTAICATQFTAGPNHETVFDGSSAQSVLIQAGGITSVTFGRLRLAPGVNLTFTRPTATTRPLQVAGDLILEAGSSASFFEAWTANVAGTVNLASTASLMGQGAGMGTWSLSATGGLTLPAGASLLDLSTLTLGSDAYTLDGLLVTTKLGLAGTANAIDQRVDGQDLIVSSNAVLAADVDVQALQLIGTLDLGAHTLNIAGNLQVPGAVVMTNPLALLTVGGNATFGTSYIPTPPVTVSTLQAGTIDISGGFNSAASRAYAPAAAHLTVLRGAGTTASFSVATILGGSQYSHFGQLQIPGSVTFTTNATVLQDVTVSGTATINASRTLSIGGLLTVDPGGTLNNNGTVNPGSCALNGTINPPGSVVCP